ncbi:hypothetical protein [Fusobacterium sp.]|uniref:hypothetical protein n=1 Tax=Fusobacterium sp. TaxID=68766 RepID=UPI0025C39D68|nr:hypothetical protein [Fusobacterium sp.]
MQFDMLNIIKEKNEQELVALLKEYGKIQLLSESAQFLDKRAYITVDTLGNLKRKRGSLALPVSAFLDEAELIAEIIDSSDIKERQNYDKIERFSSLDIEKVRLNLIKTLFNGSYDFAKKYGKELFLRDRDAFFKLLANFSLIGESSNLKPLMVLALKRSMLEFDENIFSLFISYFSKYRDNTSNYEKSLDISIEISDLKTMLRDKKELLNSLEGLGILSSLALLEEIEVDNYNRSLNKLKFEIENTVSFTPLNERERKLLNYFL